MMREREAAPRSEINREDKREVMTSGGHMYVREGKVIGWVLHIISTKTHCINHFELFIIGG